MKLAILGAGAWGTALAAHWCTRHEVRLWGRDAAQLAALTATRSTRYLPGIRLPDAVEGDPDFARAATWADALILAVPSHALRSTFAALAALHIEAPVLWVSKGFEAHSGRLPHEVAAECLPGHPAGVLSGPSFALEVAQGLPTALTLATAPAGLAWQLAAGLSSDTLRIYPNADLTGVEIGGALKNVIALAAGISDGLGLGHNARAALVTRGLAEITRLGVKLGARPETFMGLSGLGDLVLTATGDLSRNRRVGLALARGETLEAILARLGQVAEGVQSAREAHRLATEHGVDMPVTATVCALLDGHIDVRDAVSRLLQREIRSEF